MWITRLDYISVWVYTRDMKLAIKTRDTADKGYMYEIHKAGCAHLKFNKAQVWITDKYNTASELLKADMGIDNLPEDYKIMPCIKL